MSLQNASRLALLLCVGTMACLAEAATPPAVAAAPSIVSRYALGQPGGWDYLTYEASSHRLFVPRGDRVVVIDADSGKPLGEVPGTEGVHGVALVPALGKGFTSDGTSNTVTIFDLATLKVRQKLAIKGDKPDAILFDDASGHVFVFNGRSNNISVVDPVAETLLGKIELSSNPEFAVSDGHGKVYVNLEGSGALSAIDTTRNAVIATWPLGDCEEPTGLAFDAADHLTFSTCQNHRMVVFDVKQGKPVTALTIGSGPDGAAFDAVHRRVYASNGEGSLSIFKMNSPTSFTPVATVATQKSARTMALDAAGQRVFLAAAEFGTPPEPTVETPKPRAPLLPDSFLILVVR